jgi:integrase
MARRRANGEGTIYRRKGGRWCAQVSLQGKRVTFYAKTQRECRDWIKSTVATIDRGGSYESMRMTVEKYLGRWLMAAKTSIRVKTYRQYAQVVHQHIVPALGSIKLRDLRPEQIQSLYAGKLDEGASPSTVRVIHSVFHCALNRAVKWGLLGRNPASHVDKPKVSRKEMKTLTAEHVVRLLNFAQGSRYEALYHLAVTTGLRQGELLGLRWSDLDWGTGHLKVQRQLQRIPGEGLVTNEPKSASGRRLVVLGPATLNKLRDHKRCQWGERMRAGNRWEENDLIFPSTIGTPMGPRNMVREFKELLRMAGLPEVRFHDLRHTAATLMLQEGIHPKVVQERLGHSQISITMDTYSHVFPAMQEEAAIKLDELLTPVALEFQD